MLRSFEDEGALSRWVVLLNTVAHTLGQQERARLEEAFYTPSPFDVALFVNALTGRINLTLGEHQGDALPQNTGWVWGIPLESLEKASRANRFMETAFTYHLGDRYEISFVLPDGQVSDVPILYAITKVQEIGVQFRWLSSGQGAIPL